jgi:3D (Asp-Asp-Asp) domain-containing protein
MCEKGVLVMKIKVKNLTKIWLLFTIILTCACIWSVFQINILGDYLNVEECQVEVEMAGLPNLSVVEREEEVIVEKKVEVLEFPFETVDKGVMTVKGCCADCLPNKEYPKMRSKEVITAFASKDVLPEGTLVWIENVGIRQIQSLENGHKGVYIFYDSHSEAENFGSQELKIFEIVE